MPIEVERKFLVNDDGWRACCSKSERLKDGLVAASADRKVRVRIYEGRATITIKSKRRHAVRLEFEYEIPIVDAEEILALCGPFRLEKQRHYVDYDGYSWVIDEYEGLLAGKVIAEIELDDEHKDIPLPKWIGTEVTHDPEYSKIRMLTSHLYQDHDLRETMLHKCVLCYSGL